MRAMGCFWLGVLGLVSLFTVFAPGQAWAADAAQGIAAQCGPPGTIDPNNQFDMNAGNYLAAYQAGLAYTAQQTSIMLPVAQMSTQCIQTAISTINAFMTILSNANTIDLKRIVYNALVSAAMNLIIQIINTACMAVMSTINTVKNDILNIGTICLPLPSFGFGMGLNIPTVQPCALQKLLGLPGGVPVRMIGAGAPVIPVPSYPYTQFGYGSP